MIFILQFSLGSFAAGTNSFSVVSIKRPRRFGVVSVVLCVFSQNLGITVAVENIGCSHTVVAHPRRIQRSTGRHQMAYS